MAHLTERDQIELFNKWWKENGVPVVAAVVVSLGAYFGWTTWQAHQQAQIAKASAIFQQILDMKDGKINNPSAPGLTELADQLKKDFANTYYGQAVRLLTAEDAVTKGDLPSAEKELLALVDQKPTEALLLTARLRLGRVLYAEGKLDEALVQLNGAVPEAYKSLFADLRGDIFSAKGDYQRSTDSYHEAMIALPKGSQDQQQTIEMKISNLPKTAAAKPDDKVAQ